LNSERPVRQISTETDDKRRSLEQDGFDMLYQAKIKQFIDRKEALDGNLHKFYALICGSYCSKAIQSRVEDHPDFESRIRDNPIELLKTIRVLMHDMVRARYPYASLFDALSRLLTLRQQENEHLNEFIKRFKQGRDIFKSHVGTEMLNGFVSNTEEYRNETDSQKKITLKQEGFDRFMTSYVWISDGRSDHSILHGS